MEDTEPQAEWWSYESGCLGRVVLGISPGSLGRSKLKVMFSKPRTRTYNNIPAYMHCKQVNICM